MLIDPGYLGFMNFGNLWGILMLVKHVLVFGMIAVGFWFNAFLRVGPMMASNNNADLGIRRFRMYSNLMAISGVLVLLLTALAQVE
jgi:putative copper export protein